MAKENETEAKLLTPSEQKILIDLLWESYQFILDKKTRGISTRQHTTLLKEKVGGILNFLNGGKSKPCAKVLHLMDEDFSYEKALNTVLGMYPEIDKATLETELNNYI